MLFKGISKKNISSSVPLYFKRVTVSTNDDARAIFLKSPHSFSVVAAEQTGGKGRNGKSFVSKRNNGVYLSLCFPAADVRIKSELITPAVAVAAADAITGLGFEVSVKWVNDLFCGGKKIAGILCEAITDPDSKAVSGFICGIGVNTGKKGLTGELSKTAGFISADKNKLASALIENITSVLLYGTDDEIAARYRKLQFILGKEISFVYQGRHLSGVAATTDENGALTVFTDGKAFALNSGEITLGSENFTK